MSHDSDELLIVPGTASASDPLASRPKGLIEQLLHDGRIHRDFVMPGETYQVSTRFRFSPEGPSFFRCAVLRGGDEIAEAPWAPVFHRLAKPIDPEAAPQSARLAFARQALEAHLTLCQRLEQQLEKGKGLQRAGNSWLRTPISRGYLLAFLISVAALGAWYEYERRQVMLPDPIQTRLASRPPVSAPEESATPETVLDEEPVEELKPARVTTEAKSTDDVSGTASEPKTPKGEEKPVRRAALPVSPEPTPSSRPSTPPPQAKPSEQIEAPPKRETPPHAEKPSPPTTSLITRVAPADSHRLRLEEGNKIFYDSDLFLSEVPMSYRRLSCVTTNSRQGDGEHGLLIHLRHPTRVYVLHDIQVEKKPHWLAGFETHRELIQARDLDKEKILYFQVFYRDVEGRALALGANTGAKKLVKKFRGLIPKKSLIMYLVCVREGQS